MNSKEDKEKLRNLLLYKMYLTDKERDKAAPVVIVIVAIFVIVVIVGNMFKH